MDQSRDVAGRILYRLVRLYPPPEYVKAASVADLCGEGLSPDVYADPRRKLYPCHTAAATWVSTAFFLDKQAAFSTSDRQAIRERLAHFARYHGIDNAVAELTEKIAANRPTDEDQLGDDVFAVVIEDAGGKHRHYPLRNGPEVKAAAAYLAKHRDAMAFRFRQAIADKILQKAAEYGVALGEYADLVEKQAGYGACTARECAQLILDRVKMSRKGPGPYTELQLELTKLARMIAEKPSTIRQPGALYKVAGMIDDFDRAVGLKPADGVPRIEDVLFGLTREKMASVARDYATTVTGNIYKLADLETVRLDDVRGWLGDDLAEAMTSDGLRLDSEKAAEVLPTLPRGDAEMFDLLMSDVGVMPTLKEASAYTQGMSQDFLRRLAASRQPPS